MGLSPIGELIVGVILTVCGWFGNRYFSSLQKKADKTDGIGSLNTRLDACEKNINDLFNKFNEINRDAAQGKADLMEHFLQFYKDAYKR